jgi:hypothetical protein
VSGPFPVRPRVNNKRPNRPTSFRDRFSGQPNRLFTPPTRDGPSHPSRGPTQKPYRANLGGQRQRGELAGAGSLSRHGIAQADLAPCPDPLAAPLAAWLSQAMHASIRLVKRGALGELLRQYYSTDKVTFNFATGKLPAEQ